MKINSEIKVKVFAQYFGQIVLCPYLKCEKHELTIVSEQHMHEQDKLILRPLSSITDEDAMTAIKLYSVLQSPDGVITEHSQSIEKIKRAILGVSKFGGRADVCQFLISRGYDLPHYLLEGKTLKEADLAVYE